MQWGNTASASERLFGFANWLGTSDRSRGWRGYLNAAVMVALAVAIRVGLDLAFPGEAPTYIIFLGAVVLAALLGGVFPGFAATGAGWLIGHWAFVDPNYSFEASTQSWVAGVAFVVEGLAMSLIAGKLRDAVGQLVSRERELAASEARLLMAQAAARIATYQWNPATGETLWSDNAEEIMAMAPGTFRGTFEDSLRTVLPEDRPLVDAAAQELFERGFNEVDYRVVDGDGRIRWIRATGNIAGEPGSARVVGVIMDVSERRAAADHNAFLAEATAGLGSSMDYRATVASIADAAVPQFCAISCVVLIRDGQVPGEVVRLRHAKPEREGLVEGVHAILDANPETPGALARAIRAGEPLFVPSAPPSRFTEFAISSGHFQALEALEVSAIICIPLTARGMTLGGLVFAQDEGRAFTQADFDVAAEVGRRASVAIENGLLLEQSFEREAEVIRKNAALQLIADAGIELSATLDMDETVASLARLMVPRFADVCTIGMVERGHIEQSARAGATPELERAMEVLASAAQPDRQLYETAAQVLKSNRPIYLPTIPPDLYDRLASTEEQAAALERIAPISLIVMPLTARAQTLGVMTFIRVQGSHQFDREDLSLAGQLARRTAVAVDNARLYTEARRANDAKDEFLGMMSHELRTPITVIHGGARVLRSRGAHLDDESRDALLGDIERESERLSRMLENLLALARAELDGEVNLEPVLLQRLVPRLISSLESGTGRAIHMEASAEMPAVSAEPGYIEHIVRNLVGNAMKYSPPDAPIDVCLSAHEDGAGVQVMDRGFGIAPEETQRIFERFYRSDRTSRLAGGAGLGLAVCKRLVEAMSGEIWAAPRDGGGLVVGFNLPPYREEIAEL